MSALTKPAQQLSPVWVPEECLQVPYLSPWSFVPSTHTVPAIKHQTASLHLSPNQPVLCSKQRPLPNAPVSTAGNRLVVVLIKLDCRLGDRTRFLFLSLSFPLSLSYARVCTHTHTRRHTDTPLASWVADPLKPQVGLPDKTLDAQLHVNFR